MKKSSFNISLSLLVAALTGCSSVASHVNNPHAGAYAGVRQNFHDIDHPEDAKFSSYKWVNYLDVPFSATSDAITLPIDLALHSPAKEVKDGAEPTP
ncbi:YceK/YidQ family lipoprotein [Pedosphaera parvula]|uniref:Lipoprotein n=1 Tax=Pedosphaera parvula (strain Ellin514) TaxID=320771 RepID=B9XP50_PEDPL|nr:YceK/YidQ family lipoprotein [Pedosphaera parvula]EEF58406.1 protein of unknown function DUF1375 [Pedosphaera parvula Ellin514]